MATNIMTPIPLDLIDAATLLTGYLPLNVAGLPYACNILKITNASNVSVFISYDGATDHDYIPANTVFPLYNQPAAEPNAHYGLIPKGTVIYVRAPVAGVGAIYLAGWYQPR